MNYSREALDFARYQAAVADHPRGPKEGAVSYIVRLAEIVAGQPLPVRSMPDVRLPYPDDTEDGLRLDADGAR